MEQVVSSVKSLQHGVRAFSRNQTNNEKKAFSSRLNTLLRTGDSLMLTTGHVLLTEDNLIASMQDGLILCALVNICTGTKDNIINGKKLNKKENMNVFEKTENLNRALSAAAALGCHVVNIGANDILNGRDHLVLALIGQLVKIQLLSKISTLANNDPLQETHSALIRGGAGGKSTEDAASTSAGIFSSQAREKPASPLSLALSASSTLLGADPNPDSNTPKSPTSPAVASRLSPKEGEEMLLRWVNSELSVAGAGLTSVRSFGRDFSSCDVYNALLKNLDPTFKPYLSDKTCLGVFTPNTTSESAPSSPTPLEDDLRLSSAAHVIAHASRLGMEPFITPHDIVTGNPKLNLGFVAQIFNAHDSETIRNRFKDIQEIEDLQDNAVGDPDVLTEPLASDEQREMSPSLSLEVLPPASRRGSWIGASDIGIADPISTTSSGATENSASLNTSVFCGEESEAKGDVTQDDIPSRENEQRQEGAEELNSEDDIPSRENEQRQEGAEELNSEPLPENDGAAYNSLVAHYCQHFAKKTLHSSVSAHKAQI